MSTISQQVILAHYSISSIGKGKEDRTLTEEINRHHNTVDPSAGSSRRKGALRVTKQKFPAAFYEPLDAFSGRVNRFHREHTFATALGDVLSVTAFPKWKERMEAFQQEHTDLIQNHIFDRWEDWMQQAKTMLNGTFDPKLYPASATSALAHFRMEVTTAPLAKPEHTALNLLSEATVQGLRQHYESTLTHLTKQVKEDAARRILENLTHIKLKLSEEKPRLFDSMVEHLERDLSLAMAFTDDPALTALVTQARSHILVEVERLRQSPTLRLEVKNAATIMVNRFGTGGRKLAA